MNKKLLLTFILLLTISGLSARTFRHPGLLHSSEAIERTRQWVKHENPVAMGSYRKLIADPKASASYQMAGPFDIIARDGQHGRTKGPSENDFLAAYYNALRYVITGEEAHAATAMKIIRAYANRLQAIDGHDGPLCAGLQGFILVNACELLRYEYPAWTKGDTRSTESMLRRAFLPVLDEFDRLSPYANGNWGAAVNKMRLALAVYTNDAKQYARAIGYYRHGADNGSLPNYLAASGQCQESGRDQAHVMLGLGQLAETCEVAWNQGDDLYGDLDNRLLAGYEYTSRANLGLDVPFATWKDLTGKYSNWNVLAEGALGQWRAVFEIAYNHYVGRRHLAMPATSLALGHYVRPEGAGFTCDNPGFGSLLFYQGTEVDAFTAVPTPITYKVNKRRPYNVSTEPVIKLENAPRLSLVRAVDCWPEYWDLLPVRQDGNVYEYEPQGARSRNGYTFAEGEVATTFLVRAQAGLPAFVDGGASLPVLPPYSVSPLPEKDGPALSADYHVEIRRATANADEWTTVPVLRRLPSSTCRSPSSFASPATDRSRLPPSTCVHTRDSCRPSASTTAPCYCASTDRNTSAWSLAATACTTCMCWQTRHSPSTTRQLSRRPSTGWLRTRRTCSWKAPASSTSVRACTSRRTCLARKSRFHRTVPSTWLLAPL